MSDGYVSSVARHDHDAEQIHERDHVHTHQEMPDPWAVNDAKATSHAQLGELSDGMRPGSRRLQPAHTFREHVRRVIRSRAFWILATLAFFTPMVLVIAEWKQRLNESEESLEAMAPAPIEYGSPNLAYWPWTENPAFRRLGDESSSTLTAIASARDAVARYEAARGPSSRDVEFRHGISVAIEARNRFASYQAVYISAIRTGTLDECAPDDPEALPNFGLSNFDGAIFAAEQATADRDRRIAITALSSNYYLTWSSVTASMECIDTRYGDLR